MTPEQRSTLVNQLNQLYELQKLKSNQQNHCEEAPTSPPASLNNPPVQNSLPSYANRESPSRPGPRGRASYRRFVPNRPYGGSGEGHPRPHPWPLDHRDAIQGNVVGNSIPSTVIKSCRITWTGRSWTCSHHR